MDRPGEIERKPALLADWARENGKCTLLLAALYFLLGHASFHIVVDNVLVTPVHFAAEGVALALMLLRGPALWPGVFAGQLLLALSCGLPLIPSLAISAVNSAEAVMGVLLFRWLGLDTGLARARDLAGLLLLIFFVLQPFSATLGNASLWAAGIITEPSVLADSWLDWWNGNSLGQMLVAPLLLWMLGGKRTPRQMSADILYAFAMLVPAVLVTNYVVNRTGMTSLLVISVPLIVLLAVYRGMIAVCTGALFTALCALYATSYGIGPFVGEGGAGILDLNIYIIGLTLTGQFLAIFLEKDREQQKIEDELRAAREQLGRTAYELTKNIPVGTYAMEFDDKGDPHFTFLSERYLAMTGLKREEVMADHAVALRPMNAAGREEITRLNRETFATKQRFFWEGEISVRGETRQVTLESVPRDVPGRGTVWEGTMIDITERKRSAERERELEAEHRRELETKLRTSIEASAVAHEINQPLSAILLQSKMTLQDNGDERKALEVIASEADRVVKTIEKMKTLLRNVQTEHKPMNLTQVVNSALLYTKTQMERDGISVRRHGLDHECTIYGDDEQLQLALINVLRNAAEALTESDEPERDRVIGVELRGNETEAELIIGDSGPGWSEAAGAAESFETPLTTTKQQGSGIGIYVVRTAVQNHGGKIALGQSPLGGAEVKLTFQRVEKA
jgi:PAS domain S-box-containing protein